MGAWLITMGSGLHDWIYWHLLVQSRLIPINYNSSQSDCIRLAPFSFSFFFSFSFSSFPSFQNCQLRNLTLLYPLCTDPAENSLYCRQSLFTAPFPSNRSPTVPRVCFCWNVFSDSLPSNGHGVDYIENNSCNTFSIVACTYFGHCVEMGLHVTILFRHNTYNYYYYYYYWYYCP
jgi:hypothetical protein